MTSMYWPNLPLRTTSGLNVGHQPNKEFDELLDAANSALDQDTAIAKYRAVDMLNAKEMWLVPVVNDLAPVVISPKVKGFRPLFGLVVGFQKGLGRGLIPR